ncbi:hypothetical protein E2I00_012630 [Balaenoptera physalus]|uniref:60S ribosomal protein L36a n=1 Tax=Balaenoptera physalus TaxID=9770 RepID=A0A643BW17_BALPH|nr:hypothetical protein E2I00_012630 [Balaenoptera physalus]
MVNMPKTGGTFCRKCGKLQPHKVARYKKGKDYPYAQGKWHYDRKHSGYGGQTKPIFWEKAKTTKIVLRLQIKEFWLLRDVNTLNWEDLRRERAK